MTLKNTPLPCHAINLVDAFGLTKTLQIKIMPKINFHNLTPATNIIERPTTSQNINVFSVIISKLETSYKTDKKLFNREFFREFMKELNLAGGTKLFASLEKNAINQIMDDCINSADRTVTNTS